MYERSLYLQEMSPLVQYSIVKNNPLECFEAVLATCSAYETKAF